MKDLVESIWHGPKYLPLLQLDVAIRDDDHPLASDSQNFP